MQTAKLAGALSPCHFQHAAGTPRGRKRKAEQAAAAAQAQHQKREATQQGSALAASNSGASRMSAGELQMRLRRELLHPRAPEGTLLASRCLQHHCFRVSRHPVDKQPLLVASACIEQDSALATSRSGTSTRVSHTTAEVCRISMLWWEAG